MNKNSPDILQFLPGFKFYALARAGTTSMNETPQVTVPVVIALIEYV